MIVRQPGRDFNRGRVAVPTWRTGATPFAWTSIASTVPLSAVSDFSGVAWRDDTGGVKAYAAATGGHGGNLTTNDVSAIDFSAPAPAWSLLYAGGNATGWNTVGNVTSRFPADNSPAPRHVYWFAGWAGGNVNRVMLFGSQGMGSGAAQWPQLDGFDPVTRTWDAPGAYADIANSRDYISTADPTTGKLYGAWNGITIWDPTTAWSSRASYASSGTGPQPTRYGCFDQTNGDVFFINVNDNWAGGATPAFGAISVTGVLSGAYTANASAGYTDLLAATANASWFYQSLTYDIDLGGFWYYAGLPGARQKIYFIKRNVGPKTVDITLQAVTGATPPAQTGGTMNKCYYASQYKALILISPSANVHFLPTQSL